MPEEQTAQRGSKSRSVKDIAIGCLLLVAGVLLLGGVLRSCFGGEKAQPRLSAQAVDVIATIYVVGIEARMAEVNQPSPTQLLRDQPRPNWNAFASGYADIILEYAPPEGLNYGEPPLRQYAGWYRNPTDVQRVRERIAERLIELAPEQ